MPDKADLILHPIRMRIILALSNQRWTARQLASALPDVAQATLYRHLNALAEGGILEVVEENPVRGTVEKVYALPDTHSAVLGDDDVANLSKNDHLRYFTVFVATLLGDFARYLESSPEPDLRADGVGYHIHPIYLSDDELNEFAAGLRNLVQPLLENQPAPDRKRRLFSTILIPDLDQPSTLEE